MEDRLDREGRRSALESALEPAELKARPTA
jgi:hypothetical protein